MKTTATPTTEKEHCILRNTKQDLRIIQYTVKMVVVATDRKRQAAHPMMMTSLRELSSESSV